MPARLLHACPVYEAAATPPPSYSGRPPPPLLGTDLLGPGGIRLGAFEVSLIRLLGLFEALVQSFVQRFEHKVPLLFIMLLYCLQVYGSKGRLIFYFSS